MLIETTILVEPPISGSFDEVVFDARGTCSWVKFEVINGDNYEAWVGVFGLGVLLEPCDFGFDCAFHFEDDRHVFVVGNGQGYILDALQRRLIYKTRFDYIKQVMPIAGMNALVICNHWGVARIEPAGARWIIEYLTGDYIEIFEVSTEGVFGLAEQYFGSEKFKLDVSSGQVIEMA